MTARDRVIADALRGLVETLRPSTCTAYLLNEDGRRLTAAMTVNSPLSFTISPGMAVDSGHPTARAFVADDLVFADWPAMQRLISTIPEALLAVPIPMVVAAVPLVTARHRLGSVTLRWKLPATVESRHLRQLSAAVRGLAERLGELADRGTSMAPPSIPLFIDAAARPAAEPEDLPREAAEPRPAAAAADPATGRPNPGLDYLYRLLLLAGELSATVRVEDVVAVTQKHVVRVFGGRALMVCVAESQHLRVVGAAGFSREAVNRIEGMPLSRRTPETDAVTRTAVRFFATAPHLSEADQDVDLDREFQAAAYVPLIARGRAVGCCVVGFPETHTPLMAEEIALLVFMMAQVGMSLERARLYETEHRLTQTMQRSLLPRSLPHFGEADATMRYLPATEGVQVGGDWYDVIALPDGGAGFVIGDVEGHALEAAGIMGQLRSAVWAYATEGHDPGSVLERSNSLLASLDTGRYATCCCVWVDLATGTATVATAGHHAPLIKEPGGEPHQPAVPAGPPLGVTPNAIYQSRDLTLPPGTLLALFTDGMLDSRGLGTVGAVTRLAELLAGGPDENLEVLADRLVEASRPGRVLDDAALLLMRYEGPRADDTHRVGRTFVQRRDLQAVGRVRGFLDDLLAQWRLDPVREDLELLATEVVTNALIHADSEVELRLRRYPDRVRVEVRDSDPHPPVPVTILAADAASNEEAESGRGLLIVDALAAEWGSSPAGRGKTTWFDVMIPRPDPAAPPDRPRPDD